MCLCIHLIMGKKKKINLNGAFDAWLSLDLCIIVAISINFSGLYAL